MQFKTLYGPVHSGRLGLSLGVDLLGKRICSLDCLYCEVGPTRTHTLERRAYMPARTILDELHAWKSQQLPRPEHITLGGLGEPCLNSELQEIIAGSRDIFPDIPVAVLTNSTLLDDPGVRRELAEAQAVLPSLDSLVQREFQRINRPCKGLDLPRIVTGLRDFREEYIGNIYLEILLIRDYNDSDENLARLREFIPGLAPERVDVVTMTRPGASPLAQAVDARTLARWRAALRPAEHSDLPGPVLAQTADQARGAQISDNAAQELILNSLRRRPQTEDQVRDALGLDRARTKAVFFSLLRNGRIQRAVELGEEFYQAAP